MITEKFRVTCDERGSRQQVACCATHCGVPVSGNDLLVYTVADGKQTLLLKGHHGEINAMTFGHGVKPVLLCSASADYIIVWDVAHCEQRVKEGKVAAGAVIGTLLGHVAHLSFSISNERVAACSGSAAYILNSKRQEEISTMSGHLGPLTAAEFCPWNEDILVTTSEDRTFRVWDITTNTVLYQSFVLSATPLLSVLMLAQNRHVITGSAEGQVWCFSLDDDFKCQLVTKMDLQQMEKRRLGGQPSVNNMEISKTVLRMASYRSLDHSNNEQANWICIGSADGLYVVDLATSDLRTVIYFRDYPTLGIPLAASWCVSYMGNNSITFFVSSLLSASMVLLEFSLSDNSRTSTEDEIFSVFASSTPLRESPLNAELKRKPNHSSKKGDIKEQPLVFHSKVKSSGYSASPRKAMFSIKTNVLKGRTFTKPNKNVGFVIKEYPKDAAAPSVQHVNLELCTKPVCCLQYSSDGKQTLCGLGDNSVFLYKSSLSGNPSVFIGHNKPVNSVSWSLNRQYWLSASEDQSLRIWTNGSTEPAIIMSDSSLSKPMKCAQFYYLDKFVLLASGSSLYMYLYNVDVTRDDIKRYQQRSVIKLTKKISTTSGTDITGLSAVNDFLSYAVLVCGADRSIQIFDMNKCKVAAELHDAHSRAIHCITQNKGSMFTTQASESYNLFLTGAVTDGVKIWDLRTLRCVRRYDNHVNRCHPCASAISPCGQFIACGSEDNCAYMYDIRSSGYLHKLQKHSETVLSVAFNPAKPELLTGTLDGKLRLYQSTTGDHLSDPTCETLPSFQGMTL
ncbi:WD repeat-containing protein 27 isoform X1 [Synchiropus splendidus]|uniref:WD repeat-containing protein 27 isoform X1 n=1 Tax=Synchiropus splendidus TaxID=270530 RepID=UPI00237E6FE8|nr:WD repeat-containing protein 27 isoform X1 [Synchiropus splendidus]